MPARRIPKDLSWLRRYIRERLAVDLPDAADEAEAAAICCAISPADWRRLSRAWSARESRLARKWWLLRCGSLPVQKKLDGGWHWLIEQGVLSEADATLLAEFGAAPYFSWDDTGCRMVLMMALSPLVERVRRKGKADRESLKEAALRRAEQIIGADPERRATQRDRPYLPEGEAPAANP